MTTAAPVRVGVVGLGFFGRLHAATVAGLPEFDLVAVCARSGASIERLRASGYSGPAWTDFAKAVAESDAEAWIVASSTATHVDFARTALEAETSVLVEKPLATSLAAARSLRPAVEASAGRMMMGHILLFGSEFLALREEVARRGRPRFMQFARHRQAALRDDPTASPISLVMVHDLYCAQALMGQEEPLQFVAMLDKADGSAPGQLSVAQLRWADGAIASFSASFLAPEGMGEHGYDRLDVLGDGWSAILSPNPRPITVWDKQANYPMGLELRTDPPAGMLAEELRSFAAVVRGGNPPTGATFDDALQLQRWIQTLHGSQFDAPANRANRIDPKSKGAT